MQFDQLGAHLQKQADRLNDKFLKDKVAEMMLVYFKERFEEQKSPDGTPWKSDADETRLGGRFSASYTERASGSPVSAASKRWNDTGGIKNSLSVINKNWKIILKSSSNLFKYMNNIVFGNSKELIDKISIEMKNKLVSIARP